MESCHWIIFVSYKFPVLQTTDFTPRRALSVPKEIKGKYFSLEHVPYMVTWGSRVYSFSEREFNACEHFTGHIFCRTPTHIKDLLNSCLYGIVHNTPWPRLASKCPVKYQEVPSEFVEFTDSHMIYFFRMPKYATVICEENSKPLTLSGSGSIYIPIGCRVKYENIESFSMGHIARTENMALSIDNKVWHQNFSGILPHLKVTNIKNVTSLWTDTMNEEEIIKQGLSDVNRLMNFMQFSPTAMHVTLWTLVFIPFWL